MTPFQQNCSLLWCDSSQRAAVVDPGGDVDKIQAAIDETGVIVEKILLTHGHLDHVGATAEMARRFDVPIEGPQREDAFWIQGLPMQAQMFNFPAVEIFEPQRWLEQGDKVTVGEIELEVRHCPGHTPGHVVFYSAQDGLLWAGDVLFQGSIGRTDFPKGDHATLIESIHRELFSLPDETRFIPGHGPMSTIGAERRSNPFVADRYG
ncbi:beta-lactamase domain protein [gamma proteobacterium HTCC5015]|nr:beta-lactamase domain protein [gamma proteobacterium HTCC5015]